MKCPFTIGWEKITPEKAGEWLANNNSHNRPLRAEAVEALARDMKRGAWCPNHQGLAFGLNGTLKDGQHRLAACVLSKTAFWSLVASGVPDLVEGVDARVLDTIDRGATRSIADLLKLEHGLKVNASIAAHSCTVIARICVQNASNQAKRVTMGQIVAILERYRESLLWMVHGRTKNPALRLAVITGAMVFAHAVRPAETGKFYAGLCSGAGLAVGDAALTLRNHVFAGGLDLEHSAIGRRRAADLVLHAAYLQMIGTPMPRIPRPEECPGAEWFRQQQQQSVELVSGLFPSVGTGPALKQKLEGRADRPRKSERRNSAPRAAGSVVVPAMPGAPSVPPRIITPSTFKPTAAAERLLAKAHR